MAELSLWADFSHLSGIRHFVGETCEALGVPERVQYELELAVDEACTNIIEHAYCEKGGKIEIKIDAVEEGVRVIVRDWGRPFDPESVPCPDINAPLEQRPIGGVGLFLMRELMDKVEFEFDANAGNTLTMTKRL